MDMEDILKQMSERILSKEIESKFSQREVFARQLRVEAALAQAEADVGMIPREAADAIDSKAFPEAIALEEYPLLYKELMHPLVPLIKLLQKSVGEEYGQYVHFGSTTADILVTAQMLALRDVWDIVRRSMDRLDSILKNMSLKYADTLMVGRTHNIQALPITFGFKTAGWLAELRRNKDRMDQARSRIFVVQLCGAIGTMASYGKHAFELQEKFAERLGLSSPPEYCWQSSKDRFCEACNILMLIAGFLGRVARQVYLLQMTEIDELREGRLDSYVGSSAMPHKINPINSQHMRGLERMIRYRVFHVMEIMTTLDHERNMDNSVDHLKTIQEICVLMGEMMERAEILLSTLTVDEENMLRNLNLNHGVIQSEAIMYELSKYIGRKKALEIVSSCATRAILKKENFRDLLIQDETISIHLQPEKIDILLDPSNYIGFAPEIARRIAGAE